MFGVRRLRVTEVGGVRLHQSSSVYVSNSVSHRSRGAESACQLRRMGTRLVDSLSPRELACECGKEKEGKPTMKCLPWYVGEQNNQSVGFASVEKSNMFSLKPPSLKHSEVYLKQRLARIFVSPGVEK